MVNKFALSLASLNTKECLKQLARYAGRVTYAEVRIDLMEECNVVELVQESEVPLIVTCRSRSEGGMYNGDETSRLKTLAEALEKGVAFVDIEWSSVDKLNKLVEARDKIIVSQHFFDRMPSSLSDRYTALKHKAKVVKLVGNATSVTDILTVLDLLDSATTPIICLAMGTYGWPTRLLSPLFKSCFLSYLAISQRSRTAPGQLSVKDAQMLLGAFNSNYVTEIRLFRCRRISDSKVLIKRNGKTEGIIYVPVPQNINDQALTHLSRSLPQYKSQSAGQEVFPKVTILS